MVKILILGAGRVGSSMAENLLRESTEITIVDTDADRLLQLQEQLDLRTVEGNASHPSVLARAGAVEADMVLAVTNSDETNMTVCRIAASLFGTPSRIARIRASDYMIHPEIFSESCLAVTFAICPEQIVSDYISRVVAHPAALQILDFAEGRIEMVAIRASADGPLVGTPLKQLRDRRRRIDWRVVAIFRGGLSVWPEGDTVIESGDEVFFIAARGDIRVLMGEFGDQEPAVHRVMIGGGGRIGSRLARALERQYRVKVVEAAKPVCSRLARELRNALVLSGDVTDAALLKREGMASVDVYCAVTNDDEHNIMSCRLAKRLGTRRVICLINRPAYVDLLEGSEIDIAISPAQATLGPLLAHIRRVDVPVVHSLRRGAAEAMEIVVHGDDTTSRVVGRRLHELRLPDGVYVGAIARGNEIIMGHHDAQIAAEDYIVLFAEHKSVIPKVERLFLPRSQSRR